MSNSIDSVKHCLGFKNDEYVGYFSSGTIASEEGCDMIRPIEEEYIGEGGEIFFVLMKVSTFFDDEIDFITMSRSCKENLSNFKDLVSAENMQKITDMYIASLSDDEIADIGETINPEDLIMDITLYNMVAYPDEY